MTNKELYKALVVITPRRAYSALGAGYMMPTDIYAEIRANLLACMNNTGDEAPTRQAVQTWAERFAHCTACNCFSPAECVCEGEYQTDCELLMSEKGEQK